MNKAIKILFLAANPSDTSRLRLDKEIRAIDQTLRQAEFRDRFDIEQHWAVRVTDLQACLLRHKPDIVHFSGHGSTSSAIVLEDESGNSHPVSVRALGQLFAVLKDNIRCVVLNACYSEQQAKTIAEHIDCVIGMSKAIGDSSAVSFAMAFYQALGYGRAVKTAFDLGCVQIDLDGLDEQDIPKLLATNTDPREVVIVTGEELMPSSTKEHESTDGNNYSAAIDSVMEIEENNGQRGAQKDEALIDTLKWVIEGERLQKEAEDEQDFEKLNRAVQLYKAARDWKRLGSVYRSVADLLETKDQPSSRIIQMRQLAGEAFEEASEWQNAADMYKASGLEKRAAEMYRKGKCWLDAGKMYEKTGEWSQAAEMYVDAAWNSDSNDSWDVAQLFEAAGSMYVKLGSWNKAGNYYRNAAIAHGSREFTWGPRHFRHRRFNPFRQSDCDRALLRAKEMFQKAENGEALTEIEEIIRRRARNAGNTE